MKLTLKSLVNGSYFKKLQRENDDHALRCKKISQEANKWGQKKTQQLKILNPPR